MILLTFALGGLPYGALLAARPHTLPRLAPWTVRLMGGVILAMSLAVLLA